MAEKVAFLFPGQGSQFVGMGKDLMEAFPSVRTIFEQVDEVCKKSISRLCFEGPVDKLTLTQNLQPAITAMNLSCLTALNASGLHANVSAGHSLGEYAALVSAGIVGSYDALRLAQKRGELMHREAVSNPGGMAAVIGLDWEEVNELVSQLQDKGILAIANHNTAQQVVITGEEEAVSYAVQAVKAKGAKAIPLMVSGAWHCKLMEGAVKEFRLYMEGTPFKKPDSMILFNATAGQEDDPVSIKDIMARQLINPVKWYDIMLNMLEHGVDTFVEVGPRKVLSGLLKKIVPKGTNIKIYNVQDKESLDGFLTEI